MKSTRPLMHFGVLLLVLGLSTGIAVAQTNAPDPALWLGLTPEGAYRELGAPAELFPVAVDASRWQVAHYYDNYVTLYWYANHVWQVRLDRRYTGSFLGLSMGQTRDQVQNLLGASTAASEPASVPTWESWVLPFRAFSRQVRLVFENGLLVDASFYRSDL